MTAAGPPGDGADALQSVTTIERLPSRRRWWALAVIAIAQLMVVLDGTVVTIALPSAQRDLHISDANRQWAITAYTLAFGGLLLLGGRIADYAGRKRMFLVGLLGFAAASAVGGAAQNGATLFGARGVQGLFAALLAPAALSLITVTFTEAKERSRAFAVYGAVAGGGAAIGLILGGVLTEYASWRWCLLINVPIAILACLGGAILVTESKATGANSYDVPGAILGSAGLVALVYGFTEAAKPDVGWLSVEAIGYLTGAALLLIAFVLVELRTAKPMLPLRIVLDRNRGGSYIAFLLVFAGMFAMFLFLSYYLQYNRGYSALKIGHRRPAVQHREHHHLHFRARPVAAQRNQNGDAHRARPRRDRPGHLHPHIRHQQLRRHGSPRIAPDEHRPVAGVRAALEPCAHRSAGCRCLRSERGAQLESADRRDPGHSTAEHVLCERGRVPSRGPSPSADRVQPARRDPRIPHRILDRGGADRRRVHRRSGSGQRRR
jgi:MFS family permease